MGDLAGLFEPQPPKAILNVDPNAANPETLAWLEKEGLLPPNK